MAEDKSSGSAGGPGPRPKSERILARAAAAKTPEYPINFPASGSGGVVPMTITGRFAHERERLGPDFKEADRLWRVKWHKDQFLHQAEPFNVPELTKSIRNPFRRIYMAPLNYVEHKILAPRIGQEWAWVTRQIVGKGAIIYFLTLCGWYHLKYNHNTWESPFAFQVHTVKPEVLPGDPCYPLKDPRPNAEDHRDRGFKSRKVFLDV